MRKAEQNSALFDLIRKLMKIVYGKNLTEQENLAVKNISYNCDILFDTARLLYYRNIDTPDKAKRFLNPGKKYFHDPFLLSGMSEAVKKISFAKAHAQKVLIFGDYDADGVCATSVLYYCLRDYGIDPMITVPEREEGYGLSRSGTCNFVPCAPGCWTGVQCFDYTDRRWCCGLYNATSGKG